MIIFNKKEVVADIKITQPSTLKGYTTKILHHHNRKHKGLKRKKRNILSKTNQEFLESLGFTLK